MGVAKAALENEGTAAGGGVRAPEHPGQRHSAGPLDTLSSRVIANYRDMKRVHLERAPLKRSVTHEEVAHTALYLCSSLSSGVTGAVIPVDAGYSIMGV